MEDVMVWTSQLALGEGAAGPWVGWDPDLWPIPRDLDPVPVAGAPPGAAGAQWAPCEPRAVYIPSNDTLRRTLVTGPEDPKVVVAGGRPLLAFNSIPPPPLAGGGEGCGNGSYAGEWPV